MPMSSLQRRINGASGPASRVSEANNVNNTTFEKCFSHGLDLSEFKSASNNLPTTSAASELMKIKAQELQEENNLEARIAQVHATSQQKTATYELSLRAVNPHSERMGSDRDNNFLKFDNGSNDRDNGFISSLVQSYNNEKKEFNIRPKACLSKSKGFMRVNLSKVNKNGFKGNKFGCGKKVSAKKATKSKF